MSRRSIRLLGMLAAILLLVAACGAKPTKGPRFTNVRKIAFTDAEKRYILDLARSHAVDGAKPPAGEAPKAVAREEGRGVFVTAVPPNQTALTAFAWGPSIQEAVIAAAGALKRLAKSEDLAKLPLRVDVIDESTDEMLKDQKAAWRIDPSKQGLLIATTPIIALLPQEIDDWGVVDRRGRMSATQFRKVAKLRGLGSAAEDELFHAPTVHYALFTAISFMDGTDGAVWTLRRGNRVDDFDPTPDRLKRSILAGVEYLRRGMKENGQFDYCYNPHLQNSKHEYNELRHAGTVFAMTQVYAMTKDPALLASIESAMKWMTEHSRGPDNAPWEKAPWAALFDEPLKLAKLGGSGLGLLAFGRHALVTGDRGNLPVMEGYAKFIETMILPDGNVKMRYYANPGDEDKNEKDVLYYPGEAFFGLTTLHAVDNNMHWVDLASKGIDYIADVRDAKLSDAQVPHDHWLTYAIDEVNQFKSKPNQIAHAWRIFKAMDEKFNAKSDDPDLVGSYYREAQSAAAACRLEGTAALYRLARRLGDKERMDRFYAVLLKGASFLMRCQFNETSSMFFAEPKKALGGFMLSYNNPEIQIDYVQHSVSALIATLAIEEERGGKQDTVNSEQ